MIKIKTENKVAKARAPKRMKPGMARFRIQGVPRINKNNNSYQSEICFAEKLEPIPPVFPELQSTLDFINSRRIPVNGSSEPTTHAPRKPQINGHIAFKLFYHIPNSDLDAINLTHLFQGTWKACPDKQIWTKYADHYRSRERSTPFKAWLLSVTQDPEETKTASQPLTPTPVTETQSQTTDATQPSTIPDSIDFSSTDFAEDLLQPIDPYMFVYDAASAQVQSPLASSPDQSSDYDFAQPLTIRIPPAGPCIDDDYFEGNNLDTPSYIDTFITPLR